MWSQVEVDLEKMLAAKIYPALLEDPVYRAFLVFAGIKLSALGDYSVPASLRNNFRTAAKIRAHIIVTEVQRSQALDEYSAGAKLCQGDLTLYRLWDGEAPQNRVGVWWFEPQVMDTCKKSTARSPNLRRQWLRDHLAVSLDWSKLNRIDRITLTGNAEMPCIVGTGKQMPVYTPNAVSTKVSSTSRQGLPIAKTTPMEYFANLGRVFPGGVRQTVLPFIPHATGMDLNAFLNKG